MVYKDFITEKEELGTEHKSCCEYSGLTWESTVYVEGIFCCKA